MTALVPTSRRRSDTMASRRATIARSGCGNTTSPMGSWLLAGRRRALAEGASAAHQQAMVYLASPRAAIGRSAAMVLLRTVASARSPGLLGSARHCSASLAERGEHYAAAYRSGFPLGSDDGGGNLAGGADGGAGRQRR